jgi:hypothetical protein
MPDLLYVVTHGLISLVRKKDGSFDALMISMEDHRYLAGTWLNEPTIADGEFTLTGVSDDATGMPPAVVRPPELDPTRNVVVHVAAAPGLSEDVRTIIHLPRPIAVHSYYKGDISTRITGPKAAVAAVSKTLSGVQVLVYSIPNLRGDPPMLGEHPWIPVPGRLKSPLPGLAVLHLFNEPPETFLQISDNDQDDHNVNEFKKSAVLLGSQLELSSPAAAITSMAETLLPGLLHLELQPLVFREDVANSVADDLSNRSGSGAGTDPATCNPAHGDEN